MTVETAYSIGDTAWMMINGEPKQVTIVALNIICKKDFVAEVYQVRHIRGIFGVAISDLFPTKEELLKSL